MWILMLTDVCLMCWLNICELQQAPKNPQRLPEKVEILLHNNSDKNFHILYGV